MILLIAALSTEDHRRRAVAQHERRGERRARALAGGERVRMARIEKERLHARAEREAETVDHRRRRDPGAARGERRHVALAVDDRDVHGAATPVAGGEDLAVVEKRAAAARVAGTLRARCALGIDQRSARRRVALVEELGERHVDELRVAVILLAIGERELRHLGDGMDVVDAVRLETREVETGEERELLEEDRPLTPRAALVDGVAAVVERDRLLDVRLVLLEIDAREKSAVRGGVCRDLAGDVAAVKGVDRGREPVATAVSRTALLGRDETAEGAAEIAVADDVADIGEPPVGKVDRGRRRPRLTKEIGAAGDREVAEEMRRCRSAERRVQRKPALGELERRGRDVGEAARAEAVEDRQQRVWRFSKNFGSCRLVFYNFAAERLRK